MYALPGFNQNLACAGCCLYFLGNSTQNVYNGKFFDANNDFRFQMLETKRLL